MATIFSKIIEGEIPSYKVAESKLFFAFLDINPMAKGHVLVVPKTETDYLFDLDDSILSEMIIFSKKLSLAMLKAISCKRIGMMVVGLDVPHAHIHLIPINKETDMNLSSSRIRLTDEEFLQISEVISEEFTKL